METKKLYRLEPKIADRLLAVESILFFAFVCTSAIKGDWIGAVLIGLILMAQVWQRISKGHIESPLVELGEETLIFNDPMFIPTRTNRFQLTAIKLIRIIGPKKSRRVRIQTKDDEMRVALLSLRNKRLQKVINFLRKNLPEPIPVIEDEPPTFMAEVRGDY